MNQIFKENGNNSLYKKTTPAKFVYTQLFLQEEVFVAFRFTLNKQ